MLVLHCVPWVRNREKLWLLMLAVGWRPLASKTLIRSEILSTPSGINK